MISPSAQGSLKSLYVYDVDSDTIDHPKKITKGVKKSNGFHDSDLYISYPPLVKGGWGDLVTPLRENDFPQKRRKTLS
jgi:hypothetical protein